MCETARSQVALMANCGKIKRLRRLNFAKFAMRAAWLRLVRTQLPLGTIVLYCIEKKSGKKNLHNVVSKNIPATCQKATHNVKPLCTKCAQRQCSIKQRSCTTKTPCVHNEIIHLSLPSYRVCPNYLLKLSK